MSVDPGAGQQNTSETPVNVSLLPHGAEAEASSTIAPDAAPADSRQVFVVHGRNLAARQAMFEFLRSVGLQPMEWAELVKGTGATAPYIGEVLDRGFKQAQAVIILFTPDDEGQLREHMRYDDEPPWEATLTPQARLNVIFEAGMAFASHPNRTIMVEFGRLRPFSDIAGRHTVRISNRLEVRQQLLSQLELAGCRVSLRGDEWKTAGDFDAVVPPRPALKTSVIMEPAAHRLRVAVDASRQRGIEIITRADDYNAKVADLEREAKRVDKTIQRLNTVFKPEELAVTVAEQRYGPQSQLCASYVAAHAARRAAFFGKLEAGTLHHREICSKSSLEAWLRNPRHASVDRVPVSLIEQQVRDVIDTLRKYPRNYSLALSDALHPFLYAVLDDVVVVHDAVGGADIHRVNALLLREEEAVIAFKSEFELLWQSIPAGQRDNAAVAARLEEIISRPRPAEPVAG